ARNPKWSVGISVSRRILFHSAALFGSAFYLLAMAAAGYYLRFFGGNWGIVLQVVFLFGALVLLIGVLFSGSFRSWLKVFISKHFYNYNYDYREEWLRFTRTLSEDGPDLGQRTVQAVADLVESPGGALWISRESGKCEPVTHSSRAFVNVSEPLDSPFCQFLENKQWVIDLRQYCTHPEHYGAIVIPDWLRVYNKAWLVVPLILHGKLFGFVVLEQPRSTIRLNWEVIDLLKIAGSQAASYLAQKESANALMVARQFESFNRMSTFVVHDLKNLISQLSLLLPNAEKHKNNPEFQRDMLDTVDHSVKKMRLLLHKLHRDASMEKPAPLSIVKLLEQAVALKSAAVPKPVLEIVDSDLMVLAMRDRLERVIGHIIQNAIEATSKEGQVLIRLSKQGQFVVVECKDSGQGMTEDFIRDRLFKPFESTKSAGMGIGVFESREYIHELGGRLEVTSRQSIGTTFRVMLLRHGYCDATLKEA
ncbi:MAG: XrtA/PEP-CTERM system histidine kinase PrsK, partial [Oxalobacteraceae bacterium]